MSPDDDENQAAETDRWVVLMPEQSPLTMLTFPLRLLLCYALRGATKCDESQPMHLRGYRCMRYLTMKKAE